MGAGVHWTGRSSPERRVGLRLSSAVDAAERERHARVHLVRAPVQWTGQTPRRAALACDSSTPLDGAGHHGRGPVGGEIEGDGLYFGTVPPANCEPTILN